MNSNEILSAICAGFYIIFLGLTIYFTYKREKQHSLLCLGFVILMYLQMMSVPKLTIVGYSTY